MIENHPVWVDKVTARLANLTNDDVVAICDLARAECLVGPLKMGDMQLAEDYWRFFDSASVRMLPLTPEVCDRAAQIRAAFKAIKLPDALHLAAAAVHGADVFFTNDLRLSQNGFIRVETIS